MCGVTHVSVFRRDFEEEGLKAIAERTARLEGVITAERSSLTRLKQQKSSIEEEIDASEAVIAKLKEDLEGLQEILEEANKEVEQVKKTTSKAAKVLDQALKEISAAVCRFLRLLAPTLLLAAASCLPCREAPIKLKLIFCVTER